MSVDNFPGNNVDPQLVTSVQMLLEQLGLQPVTAGAAPTAVVLKE